MAELKELSLIAMYVVAVTASPNLVQANANYQAFVPTPVQVEEASSADYRRCITLAGVNTISKYNCAVVEQRLVDRRIDLRYRTILSKLSSDKAPAYRINQRSWFRVRDRDCATASRQLFNEQDMPEYIRQVTKCRLDESLRRIVWLELS